MIDNTYTFQEIIGFGGSSKVFSAVDTFNNTFAIKAIRSDKFSDKEVAKMMVLREYLVMDHVGEHPNIIKHLSCNPEGQLAHEGMTQDISYNVMEHCKNGSLSSVIKRTGGIEEKISRFMFTQLCSAVKFLHDKQFAHLDIKLENLLLDDYFNLKLADFGSGVSVQKTSGFTDHKVGTPLYMAPEIKSLEKNQNYDGCKADIYSLGVTLCLLLLGQLSDFSDSSDGSTIGSSEISEDDNMDVDIEEPKQILSTSARDLLSLMLHQDPTKRPDMTEILAHDWMTGESIDGLQESVYHELSARTTVVENTANF
jgi:serine/threonine protein kinase